MDSLNRLGPLHVKRIVRSFIRPGQRTTEGSGLVCEEAIEAIVCMLARADALADKHRGRANLGTASNTTPYFMVNGLCYVSFDKNCSDWTILTKVPVT